MSEPVNLHSDYRDDCLVVEVHGRDLLEHVDSTLEDLATTIRARPVRATLVDVRPVPGAVSFMDRFHLGEAAARLLPRGLLAVLMREDQADPRRIGQLAALNRGFKVEVFTDPQRAETWLQSAPPFGSAPPRPEI